MTPALLTRMSSPPQPLPGRGDGPLDGGIIRHIAGQRLGASARRRDLARDRLDQRAVARQQHDGGTSGERPRRALAQAAARAGHQGNFSVELRDYPSTVPDR